MPHTRKQPATRPRPPAPTAGLPPLNRQAAGSAGGRAELDGAVPPERSPAPGRRCARVTADLQAVADWLHAGHLEIVVMERTGVYGIPRCHILEARGVAVPLVNARHANNLPGRTPDSADGQGRQTRHPCGRRHSVGRPPDDLWV
jgi:hypothetical protein